MFPFSQPGGHSSAPFQLHGSSPLSSISLINSTSFSSSNIAFSLNRPAEKSVTASRTPCESEIDWIPFSIDHHAPLDVNINAVISEAISPLIITGSCGASTTVELFQQGGQGRIKTVGQAAQAELHQKERKKKKTVGHTHRSISNLLRLLDVVSKFQIYHLSILSVKEIITRSCFVRRRCFCDMLGVTTVMSLALVPLWKVWI